MFMFAVCMLILKFETVCKSTCFTSVQLEVFDYHYFKGKNFTFKVVQKIIIDVFALKTNNNNNNKILCMYR